MKSNNVYAALRKVFNLIFLILQHFTGKKYHTAFRLFLACRAFFLGAPVYLNRLNRPKSGSPVRQSLGRFVGFGDGCDQLF